MRRYGMLAMAVLLWMGGRAMAETRTKANNTTALNAVGSWVEEAVPVSGDTAVWNDVLPAANTAAIGGAVTVGSIQLTNPGGSVTIGATSANALTIDANGDLTDAGSGLTCPRRRRA